MIMDFTTIWVATLINDPCVKYFYSTHEEAMRRLGAAIEADTAPLPPTPSHVYDHYHVYPHRVQLNQEGLLLFLNKLR